MDIRKFGGKKKFYQQIILVPFSFWKFSWFVYIAEVTNCMD